MSAFLKEINQRMAVRPRVSCVTVAVMSLVHRTLVFLQRGRQKRVVLLVPRIWWGQETIYVLVLTLARTRFQVAFSRFPPGRFFTLGLWKARQWFCTVAIRLFSIHQTFWRIGNTVSRISYGSVRCTLTNVAICAISKLEVNNLMSSLTAAESLSKLFVMCVPNVSAMTFLWSRSNVTCSTTLYVYD